MDKVKRVTRKRSDAKRAGAARRADREFSLAKYPPGTLERTVAEICAYARGGRTVRIQPFTLERWACELAVNAPTVVTVEFRIGGDPTRVRRDIIATDIVNRVGAFLDVVDPRGARRSVLTVTARKGR